MASRILIKEPKLLLNDNEAGKPEGIHLMIGRRPYAAFGNSTGDQQMLRIRGVQVTERDLAMLVLHDDAAARIRLRPGAGACRTPRSAPSRRRSMMRQKRTAGR